MAYSWSAMRKCLERDYLCDSLKGRVQYFATRYREPHDNEGRVAIRIDGREVYKSCWYDWTIKRDIAWKEFNLAMGRNSSYIEACDVIELEALNKGGFDQFLFYDAFYEYHNQSISESLKSKDPIVRLFAIFDKRVGKRRLAEYVNDIEKQPEWLQFFYGLRITVEGLGNPS
ncbi:MAG: hypothetical protein LBL96_07130 [Clostridiales bacterium]|jgi:hypothetical protein|nr:hypothetical protein [Clostridiales bacterium]